MLNKFEPTKIIIVGVVPQAPSFEVFINIFSFHGTQHKKKLSFSSLASIWNFDSNIVLIHISKATLKMEKRQLFLIFCLCHEA